MCAGGPVARGSTAVSLGGREAKATQLSGALRIAPSRQHSQMAGAWRIWAQGNETYAAARDAVRVGKVSLHSNGNWQYQIGTSLQRLASPLVMSGGWLHALQIAFLISDGVLTPINDADEDARLIEVPPGTKLVLNILHSQGAAQAMRTPPKEIGGPVTFHSRLRNGRNALVTSRIMPIDALDERIIADTRAAVRTQWTGTPNPADVYLEASWHQFDATSGNAIAVIPLGPEALPMAAQTQNAAT